MFLNVKNLPLAPQYRKRLLQIDRNSVRNIQNHAKVEKTSVTCNNKRWFVGNLHVLWGLKHGMGGWLLVTHRDIFVMQNKFIVHGYIHFQTTLPSLHLSTHFPNTTKAYQTHCPQMRTFALQWSLHGVHATTRAQSIMFYDQNKHKPLQKRERTGKEYGCFPFVWKTEIFK